MDYQTIDTQVRALSESLRDADPAIIAAEGDRLRSLAASIPDDLWRARALARAERLPELITGPPAGTSEQFELAVQLQGRAASAQGSPQERIAVAETAIRAIAELADQAPDQEAGTILRMNSSLARLIEELRPDGRRD